MDLNDWINHLRPEEQEGDTLTSHAVKIQNILEHNSQHLSIREVRFGGSFAKGTMSRGRLEADVVFIVNKDSWFDRIIDDIKETLMINMGCYLNNSCTAEIKRIAITLTIPKPIGKLEFDIIPALAINSPNQMAQVTQPDFYRGSTTIFQVEYFKQQKQRFPFLADLVRLLKLWRSGSYLPDISSFMLELIAIESCYRYPTIRTVSADTLNACFKTLKDATQGLPIYPHNWVFNNNEITAIRGANGLLIVDPGDLSNNIARNISSDNIIEIRRIIDHSIKAIENGTVASLFY